MFVTNVAVGFVTLRLQTQECKWLGLALEAAALADVPGLAEPYERYLHMETMANLLLTAGELAAVSEGEREMAAVAFDVRG